MNKMGWVVDGCNQLMLPYKDDETTRQWMQRSTRHVKCVSKCLRTTQVVVVFDGTTASDETREKWRARREKEARLGKKNIPFNADLLLCDICVSLGMEVIYDTTYDGDCVIASVAARRNAHILSRDADFYRYGASEVYFFDRGRLVKTKRQVRSSLPCAPSSTQFAPYGPMTSKLVTSGEMLRGCAHPAAERWHGAPSLLNVLTNERRRIYHGRVREIFPIVDETGVVQWTDRMVTPLHDPRPWTATDAFHRLSSACRLRDVRHAETLLLALCEIEAHRRRISLGEAMSALRVCYVFARSVVRAGGVVNVKLKACRLL